MRCLSKRTRSFNTQLVAWIAPLTVRRLPGCWVLVTNVELEIDWSMVDVASAPLADAGTRILIIVGIVARGYAAIANLLEKVEESAVNRGITQLVLTTGGTGVAVAKVNQHMKGAGNASGRHGLR